MKDHQRHPMYQQKYNYNQQSPLLPKLEPMDTSLGNKHLDNQRNINTTTTIGIVTTTIGRDHEETMAISPINTSNQNTKRQVEHNCRNRW